MIDPQLLNYIRVQKQAGVDDTTLKTSLLANGWPGEGIDEAIRSLNISSQQLQEKQVPTPRLSRNRFNLWKILGITLMTLIILVGFTVAFIGLGSRESSQPEMSSFPTKSDTSLGVQASTSMSTGTTTSIDTKVPICDDFACLIPKMEKCEVAKAEISFENLFVPIVPGVVLSGKNLYEVAKSLTPTKCKLIVTFIDWNFSPTEQFKKRSLDNGMTQGQIDAQIKMINDSFNFYKNVPTLCEDEPILLGGFLRDIRDGYFNYTDMNFVGAKNASSTLEVSISSSNQKLSCSTNLNP